MRMNLRERYRWFRTWQEHPFDYANHSEHTTRCANCGTEFRDNFCPRCGQKAGVGPIGWNTVRQGIMILWGMDNRSLSFTLLYMAVFILPTWLFFRRAPRYPRHNLPEALLCRYRSRANHHGCYGLGGLVQCRGNFQFVTIMSHLSKSSISYDILF